MAKKKGHKNKGSGGKQQQQQQQENALQEDWPSAAAPHEKVQHARAYWSGLSPEAQAELLSVDLDVLREAAEQVADAAREHAEASQEWGMDMYHATQQASIEFTLDEALGRLRARGTWKLWRWGATEFFTADAFRDHVVEKLLPSELRPLVPVLDPKVLETPHEQGLRLRMTRLLEEVVGKHQALHGECQPGPGGWCNWGNGQQQRHGCKRAPHQTTEQLNASMKEFEQQSILMITEAVLEEHELLGAMLLDPIAAYIQEMLEEEGLDDTSDSCSSVQPSTSWYQDLERLSPEQVARVCEWLTEKVDALCAQLRPDAEMLAHAARACASSGVGAAPAPAPTNGSPTGTTLTAGAGAATKQAACSCGPQDVRRDTSSSFTLDRTHTNNLAPTNGVAGSKAAGTPKKGTRWQAGAHPSASKDAAASSVCSKQGSSSSSSSRKQAANGGQRQGGAMSDLAPEEVLWDLQDIGDMGDIDLWALSPDGLNLVVNPRWLQHLRARGIGDDGHPQSARDDTGGLVLEWVYGCVVSTAEKARDAAQRALGELPTAEDAYECLLGALAQQQSWGEVVRDVAAVMEDIEDARAELVAACSSHSIRLSRALRAPTDAHPSRAGCLARAGSSSQDGAAEPLTASSSSPHEDDDSSSSSNRDESESGPQFPRRVVAALLERERAMAQARATLAHYDRMMAERELQRVDAQLGVVEAEVARVQRSVSRLRMASLTGASGFGASANVDKLEGLESRLATYTAHLSRLMSKQNTLSTELSRKVVEQGQVGVWLASMHSLLDRVLGQEMEVDADGGEVLRNFGPRGRSRGFPRPILPPHLDTPELMQVSQLPGTLPQAQVKRLQLVQHRFNMQRISNSQPAWELEDAKLHHRLAAAAEAVASVLGEGAAALVHAEMTLINVACDDPGASVGLLLVLPLLQQRLDIRAAEWHGARAREMCDDLIRQEEAEKAKGSKAAAASKIGSKTKAHSKAAPAGATPAGKSGQVKDAAGPGSHAEHKDNGNVPPSQLGVDVKEVAPLSKKLAAPSSDDTVMEHDSHVRQGSSGAFTMLSTMPQSPTATAQQQAEQPFSLNRDAAGGKGAKPPAASSSSSITASRPAQQESPQGSRGQGTNGKEEPAPPAVTATPASNSEETAAAPTAAPLVGKGTPRSKKVKGSTAPAAAPRQLQGQAAEVGGRGSSEAASTGVHAGAGPAAAPDSKPAVEAPKSQARALAFDQTVQVHAPSQPPAPPTHALGQQQQLSSKATSHGLVTSAPGPSKASPPQSVTTGSSAAAIAARAEALAAAAPSLVTAPATPLIYQAAQNSGQPWPSSIAHSSDVHARPAPAAVLSDQGFSFFSAFHSTQPAQAAAQPQQTHMPQPPLSTHGTGSPQPQHHTNMLSNGLLTGLSQQAGLGALLSRAGLSHGLTPLPPHGHSAPFPHGQRSREVAVRDVHDNDDDSGVHEHDAASLLPLDASSLPSSILKDLGLEQEDACVQEPQAYAPQHPHAAPGPHGLHSPVHQMGECTSWLRHGRQLLQRPHPQGLMGQPIEPQQLHPPPPHLLCPLTRRLMMDPVCAADGYLYERTAITQWFASSRASPVTGQVFDDRRLIPVLPVAMAVREWCAAAQHVQL